MGISPGPMHEFPPIPVDASNTSQLPEACCATSLELVTACLFALFGSGHPIDLQEPAANIVDG